MTSQNDITSTCSSVDQSIFNIPLMTCRSCTRTYSWINCTYMHTWRQTQTKRKWIYTYKAVCMLASRCLTGVCLTHTCPHSSDVQHHSTTRQPGTLRQTYGWETTCLLCSRQHPLWSYSLTFLWSWGELRAMIRIIPRAVLLIFF